METKETIYGFELGLVGEDLARLEEILYKESQSEVPLVSRVSEHILKSGGKRFRPTLLILSSKLCGCEEDDYLYYAAAVEFAHTATLLHDDVVDSAMTRRGKASANFLFGNQISVLVGDFLLFKAFLLLLRNNNLRVMNLVNDIAIQMAEGEAVQLANKGKIDLSEAEYFSIIIDKTAVLMSSACQIGAILGEASRAEEEALADFGLNLGIAFQLVDDALDYKGESKSWGKEKGKDFLEAKATLPLIRAFRKADLSEKAMLADLFKDPTREDLPKVIELINNYKGIEYTIEKARQYAEQAKRHLNRFVNSPYKKALLAMADFVVQRDF